MSKTKRTLTDPDLRRYLARALRMNPLYDTAGVLALRRRVFTLAPAVAEVSLPDAGKQTALRAAAEEELNRLRREFWSLPLQPL